MFTISCLIIGIFVSLGLFQAQDGPTTDNTNSPEGTSPNRPSDAASPQTGAAASQGATAMASFNRQMFLLDKFAFQPNLFTGQKASHSSVPLRAPQESINAMLTANGDAINNWIHKITPREYAQMVPKITLSIVNILSEEQTNIPLVQGSNIRGGLVEPSQYFTNKTVGIKSFDMNIDGNTTPVTGKIYNISLTLSFDSINTFFSEIPGMTPAMTYADLFRRQGNIGSEGYAYKMKLCVYFSAAPTALADDGTPLNQKYGLGQPGNVFVSYLTLINSSLSLKENLKAEVKIEYQGYEEGLIRSEKLFNFLNIDMETARREAEAARTTAGGTRDSAVSEANRAFDEAERKAQEAFSEQNVEQLADALSEMASLDLMTGRAGDKQQRGYAVLRELEAAGLASAEEVKAVWDTPWSAGEGEEGYETRYVNLLQRESPNHPGLTIGEALIKHHIQARVLQREANGAINFSRPEGDPSAGRDNQYSRGLYDLIDIIQETPIGKAGIDLGEARSKRDQAILAAGNEYESANQTAETKLQHLRMVEIRKALHELLFSKTDVFHHIELDSTNMNAYIESVQRNQQKNYFDNLQSSGAGNPSTSRSGLDPTNPVDQPTVPEGSEGEQSGSGTSQSQQRIEELAKERETINEALEAYARRAAVLRQRRDAQDANRDAASGSESYFDALDAQQQLELLNSERDMNSQLTSEDLEEMGGTAQLRAMVTRLSFDVVEGLDNYVGGAISERALENIAEKRKELEERLAKIREEEKAANENLSSVGAKSDLEKRLTEYIYFGDMLALIMEHLVRNAKNDAQVVHYNRIRFYLTSLTLPNVSGQLVERGLYNTPIDLAQIQKLFADKLYGNQKNTITLLEFVRDIVRIIALSQQRKARLLQKSNSTMTYSLSIMPYPLDGEGQLSVNPLSADGVLHGMILRVRDATQNLQGADGSMRSNIVRNIPHFYLGGAPTGAVKSIEVSEIDDDDFKKVAFRRLTGGDDVSTGVLPALFNAKIKLYGSPFLHMGMYFYLGSPTLKKTPNQGWFFLDGYYSIKSLSHSYSAGGQYITEIEGMIQTDHASAAGQSRAIRLLDALTAGGAIAGSELGLAAADATEAITTGVSAATEALSSAVSDAAGLLSNLPGGGGEGE